MTTKRAEITVKTVADSITDGGDRLTTFEWTYPRCIHSEVLTHGSLRRNSASSRAIPASTLRRRVIDEPFIPMHWGQNQKGMQADGEITDTAEAEAWWLRARTSAAEFHREGEALGLHKQVVNRVIEPFMTITIIISATDWANFFHLRKHKDAEPHFQRLAGLAWEAYHDVMPTYRKPGEWHLPYADDSGTWMSTVNHLVPNLPELPAIGEDNVLFPHIDRNAVSDTLRKIATGRCARVSYLTHNGVRDVVEDIALHDRLIQNGKDGGPMHMSPFEHPCMAVGDGKRIGPFTGWRQYRKMFDGEAGPDTSNKCKTCGCWGGNHARGCSAPSVRA